MIKQIFIILFLAILSTSIFAETSSLSIDFVIFIDTSLSMVDAIEEAKQFVAGEIVGRLTEPGDWLALYKFYGKSELLWQGYINSEAEVAPLVRKLNSVKADGRFTDIGSALDVMEGVLKDRALPDRPKYILLITDERQEAPQDSRYYSPDYKIHHPMLEYIKRVDMGEYRVITIGYGLSARIDIEAKNLLTTLREAPARTEKDLPGSTNFENDGSTATKSKDDVTSGTAGTGQSEESAKVVKSGKLLSGSQKENASLQGAILAAIIAGAAALGIFITIIVSRRKKNKNVKDEHKKTGSST